MATSKKDLESLPLPDDNFKRLESETSSITALPPAYTAPIYSSASRKWYQLPTAREIGSFKLKPYEKETLSEPARIFGIRRLYFLAGTGILLLIIMIIGLAAGLSGKKKLDLFLPIPTSSQTFKGDATYYDTGLGACGFTNAGSEHVIAVSHFLWDSQSTGSNPNANPLCGLMIRATRYRPNNEAFLIGAPGAKDTPGGRNVSIDVKIVDRCTGCAPTDLDFSRGAFATLADEAMGRVLIDWAWL